MADDALIQSKSAILLTAHGASDSFFPSKELMKRTALSLFVAAASLISIMAADQKNEIYEMRVYYAPEGKLDDLHARFRDHTLKLFEKHGIRNVGYFVPEGANPERKLVYFLAYPDRDARNRSWKDFMSDADWQKAHKESEKNGKLVSKIEDVFMKATDYSPNLKVDAKGGRIFEMRTYTTPDGKLNDLNARFRNHTLRLFEKHGMENVIYWTKTPDQKDAGTTLIYLLAHKDKDAAKKSFDAFRQDPDWVKAKSESEKNGSLTVQNGVKSEFLVPTDYSPLK
jgi:hypothetical protein